MNISMQPVDRVDILTLQDNYIDILARDNSDVISRAVPLEGMEVKNSILAEHGFSAMITTSTGETSRSLLFDFGFSPHGAAMNAKTLKADLARVEIMALSHGHLDHVGGIQQVIHPEVFRDPRYMKITEDLKVFFPPFTRQNAEDAQVSLIETAAPYPMLDSQALFLSQIESTTEFEKGAPSLWYEKDGIEQPDTFEDDTALAFVVKDKGLVVLSGCAHSGIVNTVDYAKKITGVDEVYAVMGGFHLSGPDQAPVVRPTIEALTKIDPAWIVPTHCTGRDAIQKIESAFGKGFVLNMAGTRLTFAADQ
jgi:7,8-dihydropterin-6-yl-methyl-4-(beta-D-ribofuranosyl)aminobenzene 5'-phosphate synthase